MNRLLTRRPHNPGRTNTIITNTCLGTAVTVFAAWNLTEPIRTFPAIEKLRSQLPTTEIRQTLTKYFILKSDDPTNYPSWLGSALSHRGLTHLAFNLLTWHSFSKMLFFLPPIHTAGLLLGSAVASSAAFLYDARGTMRYGLGSSGIVSGVLMTCTMFAPLSQASIMGIVPVPLVALTAGYFLMDSYFVQGGQSTGVGHSAHLGGGVFGAVYYAVFLRRFGGVLGKVRWGSSWGQC